MVYFGSGHFGAIVLTSLIEQHHTPELVVTQHDDQDVHRVAHIHHLPLIAPTHLTELRDRLPRSVDHFLVASFGRILPPWLLAIPTRGVLNIHPSLLPTYRGPSPIQATILSGDSETGVTLMLMDNEVDHGPIIGNCKFRISDLRMTKPELEKELAVLGAHRYCTTIDAWIAGSIVPKPQDHARATYTKTVRRDDGHIDWTKSAIVIDRMRRAYDPWPGIWTRDNEQRLKIIDGTPFHTSRHEVPGTVVLDEERVAVVCGEGIYLLTTVQREGRRALPMNAFVRGQRRFIGSVLR